MDMVIMDTWEMDMVNTGMLVVDMVDMGMEPSQLVHYSKWTWSSFWLLSHSAVLNENRDIFLGGGTSLT